MNIPKTGESFMPQSGFVVYNTFHDKIMSIYFDEEEAEHAAEDAQQFFGDKMLVIPALVSAMVEENH